MAESVTFDHSIYSPDSISAAVEAYAGLLSVTLADDEGATTARFDELDPDEGEMLVDAFCNHVLYESIQRNRINEANA